MVADKIGGGALKSSLAALGFGFGFAVFTVAPHLGKSGDMLPSVFLSGVFAIFIACAVCLHPQLPVLLPPRDGVIAMAVGVFQVGTGFILYMLGSRGLPAAELVSLSLPEILLGPVSA